MVMELAVFVLVLGLAILSMLHLPAGSVARVVGIIRVEMTIVGVMPAVLGEHANCDHEEHNDGNNGRGNPEAEAVAMRLKPVIATVPVVKSTHCAGQRSENQGSAWAGHDGFRQRGRVFSLSRTHTIWRAV